MSHYFDPVGESPHPGRTLSLKVAGRELTLQSGGGVFGRNAVDTGTQVLLDSVSPPASAGELLDIGCGYGPIALSMAALAPAATVWAVDVNERAVDLTTANATELGLANLHAATPERVPADIRFAAIWSNPPIRVGKDALHDLLTTWMARLEPSGAAWLVVHRHLGGDSLAAWLTTTGWDVRRHASKQGYRILQATRHTPCGSPVRQPR